MASTSVPPAWTKLADPPLAVILARQVVATRLADLPSSVTDKAKAHLLDQLGCQLLGATLETTYAVRLYAREISRPGPATVIGTPDQLDAEYAALVNASTGHGFELDDYAVLAFTHPGCEVVPAALAAAEQADASGEELLRAVALGFETVVRIGLATMPSMLIDRGLHENCMHAVIGSAVAAGILLDLTADELAMAVSIAVSHASGTTEYSQSGGEVKRIHAGLGGMGAIRAVRLAKLGLTGPPTILEGTRGYFQAFTGSAKPSEVTAEWGTDWRFPRYASTKFFSCAAPIGAHIQALDLIRAHRDLVPGEIASIAVGTDQFGLIHLGSIGPEPTDLVAAQFSLHFSIAMNVVLGGNSPLTYEAMRRSAFADRAVIALARRVSVAHDDFADCEYRYPAARPGRVTVTFTDGAVESAVAYPLGTPFNPMTDIQLRSKFQDLSAAVLPDRQANAVADAVLDLEKLGSARSLGRMLAKADGRL
jgi:2-methylcitrate dehydratase PrpD